MSAAPSEAPQVVRIWQVDDRTVGITWTTGRERLYDVVALRRACPCAYCVDEDTGVRTLDPRRVPETVRPQRIVNVGSYALRVFFDDGHDTGMYRYAWLHNAGAEPAG